MVWPCIKCHVTVTTDTSVTASLTTDASVTTSLTTDTSVTTSLTADHIPLVVHEQPPPSHGGALDLHAPPHHLQVLPEVARHLQRADPLLHGLLAVPDGGGGGGGGGEGGGGRGHGIGRSGRSGGSSSSGRSTRSSRSGWSNANLMKGYMVLG